MLSDAKNQMLVEADVGNAGFAVRRVGRHDEENLMIPGDRQRLVVVGPWVYLTQTQLLMAQGISRVLWLPQLEPSMRITQELPKATYIIIMCPSKTAEAFSMKT